MRPLESVVRDDLIGTGPSVSIGDVVPDLLEKEYAYAFFSRKFFPHPGCDVARDRGERIYETLVDEFGRTLARDYFRLDYVLAYFVARTTSRGTRELPVAGAFGREHLYSYLPLRAALATSRYS